MGTRTRFVAIPACIGVGLIAARALADPPAGLEVAATQDTWISSAPSHQNHGTDAVLRVGGPGDGRTLVRMERTAIQAALAGRPLLQARLELTIKGTSQNWGHQSHGVSARTVDAHRLTRAWTENGATWDSPSDSGPRPSVRWDMDGRGDRDDRDDHNGRGHGKDKDRDDDRDHDHDHDGHHGSSRPYAEEPSASKVVAAGQSGTLSFDVTADVLAVLGGADDHGWLLKRRDEGKPGLLELGSRESGTKPRLVLSVGDPSTANVSLVAGDQQFAKPGEELPDPLVVAVRTSGGQGLPGIPVTFSVTSGAATLLGTQPVVTDGAGVARIRLRLGAAPGLVQVTATALGVPGAVALRATALPPPVVIAPVADTYVGQLRPNRNHGAEPILRVRALGRDRTLVRFDQAQLAAAVLGGALRRAELELTIDSVHVPDGCRPRAFEVGAHRMLQAWTEQGATWKCPDDANPGNNRPDGPRWSMSHGPLPFLGSATDALPLERGQSGAVRFDVTQDVLAFLSGTANHGWLLRSARENGIGRVDFRSRETGQAPRLLLFLADTTGPTVTVTSPAQGACVGTSALAQATYSDPNGVVPSTLRVLANGQDVSAAFTAGPASAEASLAAIQSSLVQGPNVLQVSIEDPFTNLGSGSVSFEFDSIAPILSLEPADAAVVRSDQVLLQASYADAGCGLDLASLQVVLDGVDVTSQVAVTTSQATLVLPLAEGPHTWAAAISDRAGNRTSRVAAFVVDRGAELSGMVLGGPHHFTLQSLQGIKVRALPDGPETFTDAQGAFVLPGLPRGRVVVVAEGIEHGYGRVPMVLDLVSGRNESDRAWILPTLELSTGTVLQLDAGGRTIATHTLTHPDTPLVVTIPPGARVTLPAGVDFPPGALPTLTLVRVALPTIPNPLPGVEYAPVLYALEPQGTVVEGGFTVSFPNDQSFAPGEVVPLRVFDLDSGTFVSPGALTVSADGLQLTGAGGDRLGLAAPVSIGHPVDVSGQVDLTAATTKRAVVQWAGRSLLRVVSPSAALHTFGATLPTRARAVTPIDLLVVAEDAIFSSAASFNFDPNAPGPNGIFQAPPPPPPQRPNPFRPPSPPTAPTTGSNQGNTGQVPVINTTGLPAVVNARPAPGTVLFVSTLGDATRFVRVVARSVSTGAENDILLFTRATSLELGSPGVGINPLPDGVYDLIFYFQVAPGVTTTLTFQGTPTRQVVDGTPPVATLFSQVGSPFGGGRITNLNQATFFLALDDPNAGVQSYEVQHGVRHPVTGVFTWTNVPGGSFAPGTLGLVNQVRPVHDPALGTGLTFSLPLQNDTNYLRVVARDTAAFLGNESFSQPYPIYRDTQAPIFTSIVFEPPAIRAGPARIDFSVQDNPSLALIELLRDNVPVQSIPGNDLPALSGLFNEFFLGTYRYRLRATDTAGNVTVSAAFFDYTFDNLPPQVSVDVAPNPVGALAPTVSIAATDQGRAGLESYSLFRVNQRTGALVNLVTNSPLSGVPSVSFPFLDATLTEDGRYVYVASFVDRAANSAIGNSPVLIRDTSPPVIGFAFPDGTVRGAGVELYTITFDENVGLDPASVNVLLDGATLIAPVSSFSQQLNPETMRTTYNYVIQRLKDGPHTVSASASDVLANAATPVSVSFLKDNFGPEITSFTPAGQPVPTNALTHTFSATYQDAVSSVNPALVTLALRSVAPDGTVTNQNVTPQATITATSASVTLLLGNGTHTATLTVVDLGGNATVATSTVIVDAIPPTVSATGPVLLPGWNTDPTPTLLATFQDDPGGSGIDPAATMVLVDLAPVGTQAVATAGGLTFTPATPLTDGGHSYEVRIQDRAGNIAFTRLTFQVDQTPPTTPGRPVAGARPFEPTTVLRWFASQDAGSGVVDYLLERTEDGGKTWTVVLQTAGLEATVPFPTGERTRFRLTSRDLAGNRSAPVIAEGCEVAALEDLAVPVTTAMRIEVQRSDGSPVLDAVVSERGTGAPLVHQGGGLYTSGSITVPAGQPLLLDVLVDGEPFVSGPLLPLLPETVSTNFGTIQVSRRRLQRHVIAAAGRTPGAPGADGLGGTLGEPTAAGPPASQSSRHELLAGFWHGVEIEGEATVNVLQVPPVICARYVPVYFEVVSDLTSTTVAVEYSTDAGQTWAPATLPVGSVASLAGTPLGVRHVVIWDAGLDLGALSLADVLVRVSPAGLPLRGQSVATTIVRAFWVESATPASGDLEVDPLASFELLLSAEPTANAANLQSSILLLDLVSGLAQPLSFVVAGRRLTATPQSALELGHPYQLVVLPSLQAASETVVFDQDPLAAGITGFAAHYRTATADALPPRLVSTFPASGATGVSPGTPIQLLFSEPLDPASVSAASVTLTSAAGGVVPATVQLLAGGQVIQVTATLLPGQSYSLAVSPSIRDLSGVALDQLVTAHFATVPGAIPVPAAPVLLSPAAGATVTVASPPISGTGPANYSLRLYVDGLPTGITTGVLPDGTWSLVPSPLPEGQVSLAVVAFAPDGSVASSLSSAVLIEVSTTRLPPTPPPPVGSFPLHEILVGGLVGDPYRAQLVFSGPPGAPVVLDANAGGGLIQNAQLLVAAANGGASLELTPGQRTLAGLFFDAGGQFSAQVVSSDVVGDQTQLLLQSPDRATTYGGKTVQQRTAAAFLQTSSTPPLLQSSPIQLSARARLLDGENGPRVMAAANALLMIKAFNLATGLPTDTVTIGGQPGSSGLEVTCGAAGAASFNVQQLTPDPVVLRAFDRSAWNRLGDLLEQPHIGQIVLGGSPTTFPAAWVATDQTDPENGAAGYMGSTVGTTKNDCPDPIYFHNGGQFLDRVDLAIPGRGLHFAFSRTYKSYVLYDGPLGRGWTHGYDQRLNRLPSGEVTWLTGTNRQESWILVGGRYVAPTGFFSDLTVTADVGTIRTRDGTRLVFRPFTSVLAPGALDTIRDRHGNELRFEYGTTGSALHQLTAVIEPLGRRVVLEYDLNGRISRLRDWLGREVKYEYSALGQLVRVTSPVALQTTTGEPLLPDQQFPEGRSEVYAYTRGWADERLNHKLLMIVAPEEARGLTAADLEDHDRLRPLARMENTYDVDPSSPNFGRVIRQRLGGTSVLPPWTRESAPRQAGGTFHLSYEALPVPPGASLNHPVSVTRVIDRTGNLTEMFFNQAGQRVRVREHTNRGVRPRGSGPGQDPAYFEATAVFNRDGLQLNRVLPLGNLSRWVYGSEDLNGDGVLTAGEDRTGDGDFDDPEDVQPEDDPRYAFAPGNGVLDALPRAGAANLFRSEAVPDAARGDTRGGALPRVSTFAFEPVYNQLVRSTDARGNDPTYTPQNGGPASAARYTTTRFFDYQQGPAAATRALLAQELNVTPAELDALLLQAGVALGLGDLNGSVLDDARIAGDAVRIEAPSVHLTPEQTRLRAFYGGDTQPIVTLLEFNEHGQPIRTVDAELNVHTFGYHPEFDPGGAGLPEPGVPTGNPTGGYLHTVTVDASLAVGRNTGTNPTPVGATTRTFYDRVGNVVRAIDSRGVEHRSSVNPLNEVVRTRAATDLPGPFVNEPAGALQVLDYETLVIHDHNGRVVEVRGENAGERDGTNVTVAANPYWSRKLAYDLLDDLVVTLAEVEPVADDAALDVGSPGVIVARQSFDPGQNLALVTKPEGNQVAYLYDERNLLFQTLDGVGTQDVGTVTIHRDLNGNPTLVVDSVKHNPTKNVAFPTGDVTMLTFNGFDEQICAMDAEGNCGDAVFDPLGQRVRQVRHGPDEEGEPRLMEVEHHYDELGRLFRSDARLFTTQASWSGFSAPYVPVVGDPVPAGEEEAISLVELDALGRMVRAVDPKGDESLAVWDGASRLVQAFGPEFSAATGGASVRNEVATVYNQAGQPVRVTSIDRSPVAGVPAEAFTSFAVFDALGRLVRATDPAGQTSRLVFDSRNNVIAASDAKSSVLTPDPLGLYTAGQINAHGNVVHTYFDGVSRPLRTQLLLKQGGVGNGQLDLSGSFTGLDLTNPANTDGLITIEQRFDRNSRLVARADDNRNQTGWVFDSRDRVVAVVGADLTASRTVYDADSMPFQSIDRNGTTIERTFDGVGRTRRVDVTRLATNLEGTGQSVEGSILQAYEYDGLHRLRLAVDQNDPANPSDDVATSFTWDSLSRQLTERHRFRVPTGVAPGAASTIGLITVGSAAIDRTIARTFDLDSNQTSLTYGSGRVLSYQLDGLDRVQRIVDGALGVGPAIQTCEWIGGRPLRCDAGNGVRTSYAYDQKRRLTALDHVAGLGGGARVAGFSYAWDRADQRASETHLPAIGVVARTEGYSYDSASRVVQVSHGDGRPDTSYLIDGVGNWARRTEGGETLALNVWQNGRYQPDLMNEVLKLIRFDAAGSVLGEEGHTQDPNGNRIQEGQFRLFWDSFDRLVRVERTSDGMVVGRYRYDALSRRVDRSFVALGEVASQQVFHLHDGGQEVEELDASGSVLADFVWGDMYVDQLVQLRRGGQSYWAHSSSIYSVAALSDASGATVERYAYESIYGVCSVRDEAGVPSVPSAEVGNPWRFQGRRFDPETGWLHFRLRQLDPTAGRFVSRDPLGLWGDPLQRGSPYSIEGSNPVNRLDPTGTQDQGAKARAAEVNVDRDYLTSEEFLLLSEHAPERLKEYYENFLGRHVKHIREAAKAKGVPEWLLASVVVGESINLDDTVLGIPERVVEGFVGDMFASSVGIAQITTATAVRRNLVPQRFLFPPGLAIPCLTPTSYPGYVREKLLHSDEASIWASAEFLRQLREEAAAAASNPNGAKPTRQFGDFDWASKSWEDLAKSFRIPGAAQYGEENLKQLLGGYSMEDFGRLQLAQFFGAAHNDDRATGDYAEGSGMGQALWAGRAFRTMFDLGIMSRIPSRD